MIVKKYNVISGLLTYLGASGMLSSCGELDSQLRKRSVSRARAVNVLKTPKIEFQNASTISVTGDEQLFRKHKPTSSHMPGAPR